MYVHLQVDLKGVVMSPTQRFVFILIPPVRRKGKGKRKRMACLNGSSTVASEHHIASLRVRISTWIETRTVTETTE